MASRLTPADRVGALAALGLTQTQIGKRLGVTSRTVRRWKNEGVTPNAAHAAKLTREGGRAREEVRRLNRRVARGAPVPVGPVLPPGTRRKIRLRDREGRDTGRTRSSEWVNYSVKGMGRAQIMALFASLNAQGATVQLLYDAPATDPYFEGRVTHEQLRDRQKIRGGSVPEILSKIPAARLEQFYREEFGVAGRVPLYIAVLDRGKLF